jgi:hypothetical protein
MTLGFVILWDDDTRDGLPAPVWVSSSYTMTLGFVILWEDDT